MSRAGSVADALAAGLLPRAYSSGGYQVIITRYTATDTSVTVWGDVTKAGVSLPISWPVVVVNPPTLVPDANGDVTRTVLTDGGERTQRLRTDPLGALYETLLGVARGVS